MPRKKFSFHLSDEAENSPIEEVWLTVPTTDDKTLPSLTFRTWTLGLATCALLAFLNEFFFFHQNQIFISPACTQLVLLPVGRWMAAALPERPIEIPWMNWTFTMNPGPFNAKEHVLVTLFASSGLARPYASRFISLMKAFYHRKIDILAAFPLMLTSQLIGYGFSGLLIKFLVDSPYMWWPETLVNVSTYRSLHEVEVRSKKQLTRFQFFLTVFISSFAYHIIPNYFFPSISAISVICWIWKDSVVAHQIGGGYNGLGLGSFGLDWAAISGTLGSPLADPALALLNVIVGLVLVLYIATPTAYWTNAYNARRFPIFSPELFDKNGQDYNISRILDGENFELDEEAYKKYSPIYMSAYMQYQYGFSFASVTAALTHVALYNGWSIWKQIRDACENENKRSDVHTKLMKENYDSIPQWWFLAILFTMVGLAIFTVEEFRGQLQLPCWGVLLACSLVLIFILPFGVIQATTNQKLSLTVVPELIIGYLYPGKPAAATAFKSYSLMSLHQALFFLSDFKFGHYMKVPPKSMFIVQVVATVVSCFVSFTTEWWIFSTSENICNTAKLPKGSPWTCPTENVLYSMSNVWGLIGPARVFAPNGIYSSLYLYFLIGIFVTVFAWSLSRMFPHKSWIQFINVPVILGVARNMPIYKPVNYWSYFIVGLLFNVVVYKKYKWWWAKYNYVLSSGLDTGVAFMAFLVNILQFQGVFGINWWGLGVDDHCPLAQCPTAPGMKVDGCPVFT